MGRNMKKIFFASITAIFLFSIGLTALAEEGSQRGEGHEKSEYYERSDDGENKGEGNGYVQSQNAAPVPDITSEYWNIWSQKALNNPNNPLPISTPSELSVSINGQAAKLYFIPQEGQLLVSGDDIAKLLGAQSKYYPQSSILVIKKDKVELAVGIDSNAAYVNKVKNPMPIKAASYENKVYLPVSIAANALEYRITFNSQNKTLIFQSI